jgi:hypothetical protein
MHLSLRRNAALASSSFVAALGAEAHRASRREMKLQRALGTSLLLARGADAPEIGATWTRILETAASLDDAGLWVFHINSGQLQCALRLAQRFRTLAASGPTRVIGWSVSD